MRKERILLIIAHEGYQPIEYGAPKEMLKDAGFEVVTASNQMGTAVAKGGSTTSVDVILNRIAPTEYGGIFFIGGPGAMDHLDNDISYAIAQDAARQNIALGAICISPRILAKAGVLSGRHATGWDGDGELAKIFETYDIILDQKPVVVDGNIITATGPTSAIEFGQAILDLLEESNS